MGVPKKITQRMLYTSIKIRVFQIKNHLVTFQTGGGACVKAQWCQSA